MNFCFGNLRFLVRKNLVSLFGIVVVLEETSFAMLCENEKDPDPSQTTDNVDSSGRSVSLWCHVEAVFLDGTLSIQTDVSSEVFRKASLTSASPIHIWRTIGTSVCRAVRPHEAAGVC